MMTRDERAALAKGLVMGIFAGGAVAAALAILYAPKKGSELRAEIGEKRKALAKDVEEMTKRAKSRAHDVVEGTKQKVRTEETRLVGAVKAGVAAFSDAHGHA